MEYIYSIRKHHNSSRIYIYVIKEEEEKNWKVDICKKSKKLFT